MPSRTSNYNDPARNYCFTLNNPTDREIEALQAADTKYVVYQHERGENGTHHLQGYVVFSKFFLKNSNLGFC